jgi:hypothetical protein
VDFSPARRGIGKLLLVTATVLVVVLLVAAAIPVYLSQRADFGWNPGVASPRFASTHPLAVVDQAHHNASTAGWGNRYWPFARLLRADGYDVREGTRAFEPGSLRDVDVLVIANASGAAKPQFLGINLPVRRVGRREDPAFTAEEVRTVADWVERGGSLLLIADHAPFGSAAEAMAAAFGVRMGKGFVEVPDEKSDPLLFSTQNERLGDHPILSGDASGGVVRRVMTFTGQSLSGPAGSAVLLRLPRSAVEYVPDGSNLEPRPAGEAQALALSWGQGRVVVLGEAAMLTAQVANGIPFGMNSPGNDNRQFALNTMHWLSRAL